MSSESSARTLLEQNRAGSVPAARLVEWLLLPAGTTMPR